MSKSAQFEIARVGVGNGMTLRVLGSTMMTIITTRMRGGTG